MGERSKKLQKNATFPGFPPEPVTNYWPYPKALNGWWHILTPTEQKVLDYILRHTWGYKKTADAISLSQFINGIVRKDGTVVDKGTGIKNEKTVRKALRGLVVKGFIERQDRSHIGREPIYELKIDSSLQEMGPLPNIGIPPVPSNGSTPSQETEPTIKDIPIKDTNNIAASQEHAKKSYKGEITQLINYLSEKLGGIRFPNYGKQAKYVKAMLDTDYTIDDIRWAIDTMFKNKWWQENSFDMKNVADEIPKLMSRTYKE